MSKWMKYCVEMPQQLGELFDLKPLSGGVKQPCKHGTTESKDGLNRAIVQPNNARSPAQDFCKNRHKGNPQSVAAHNTIKERLTVQQERVFRCVKDGGERGRTNEDICGVLGLTPNQVSPRLTELHIAGRITKIGTRLTRSKCSAGVWKVEMNLNAVPVLAESPTAHVEHGGGSEARESTNNREQAKSLASSDSRGGVQATLSDGSERSTRSKVRQQCSILPATLVAMILSSLSFFLYAIR